MKRGVIAAILIIGLFVLWEVLRGGPRAEGVYLGYVEGDLLYIGPIEEAVAAVMWAPDYPSYC